MCKGARPMGAAKGKETNTTGSCQSPPPSHVPSSPPPARVALLSSLRRHHALDPRLQVPPDRVPAKAQHGKEFPDGGSAESLLSELLEEDSPVAGDPEGALHARLFHVCHDPAVYPGNASSDISSQKLHAEHPPGVLECIIHPQIEPCCWPEPWAVALCLSPLNVPHILGTFFFCKSSEQTGPHMPPAPGAPLATASSLRWGFTKPGLWTDVGCQFRPNSSFGELD